MSTKMSKKYEAMTVKNKSLGNHQQTLKTPEQRVTMTPSKNVYLVCQNHVIEVSIKNKGQKRTSPVASFSPGQKAEKKRSTTNDGETPRNWGDVFGQQNLLHMTKEQPTEFDKRSEDREAKKDINAKKQQKSTVKHLEQETKVESGAVPLKESNEKMKAMSYEFMLEREKLQSEILKRNGQLKEVDKKCKELAFHANMLTQQLDEATRKKNDTVSALKKQIEDDEKIIADLKTRLNKQTELECKSDIDNKCLRIEIDKLLHLSSYKDLQISDYRNTIRDLQNQIAKQLETLNEIYTKEASPQISLIHRHACSSPTPSFSDGSNKSLLHDLSDISSVHSVPEEHAPKEDAPVRDFELVSLLDGESSRSIMLDQNEVPNDKGAEIQNNNENNTVPYQNMNANDVTAKKSLHHSSKNGHNKENDTYKTKKFTRRKETQNDNTKNLFLNASKVLESIVSSKSTASDIRKQGDMQNRKPVNVPSPLRDCPHPDWSDSSLPSISTISNLVPSNDV